MVVVFQDGSAQPASSFSNGSAAAQMASSTDRITLTASSFKQQLAVLWSSAEPNRNDVYADVYRSQVGFNSGQVQFSFLVKCRFSLLARPPQRGPGAACTSPM